MFAAARKQEVKYVVLVDDLEHAVARGDSVGWMRCADNVFATAGNDLDDTTTRTFFRFLLELPATSGTDIAALAAESFGEAVTPIVKDVCKVDFCTFGDAAAAFTSTRIRLAKTSLPQESLAEVLREELAAVVSRHRIWQRNLKRKGGSRNYGGGKAGPRRDGADGNYRERNILLQQALQNQARLCKCKSFYSARNYVI